MAMAATSAVKTDSRYDECWLMQACAILGAQSHQPTWSLGRGEPTEPTSHTQHSHNATLDSTCLSIIVIPLQNGIAARLMLLYV